MTKSLTNPRSYVVASSVIAVLATLLLVLPLGHRWLRFALERHHDHQLQEAGQRLKEQLGRGSVDEATAAIAIKAARVESMMTFAILRTSDGKVLYPSDALSEPVSEFRENAALIQAASERAVETLLTVRASDEDEARVLSVPLGSTSATIQIGVLLGDTDSWLHAIEFWAVVLVPAVLGLTVLGASVASGSLNRRLKRS